MGQGKACRMDKRPPPPRPQEWKLGVIVSPFMALGPEMAHDEGLSYLGQVSLWC